MFVLLKLKTKNEIWNITYEMYISKQLKRNFHLFFFTLTKNLLCWILVQKISKLSCRDILSFFDQHCHLEIYMIKVNSVNKFKVQIQLLQLLPFRGLFSQVHFANHLLIFSLALLFFKIQSHISELPYNAHQSLPFNNEGEFLG